MTHSQVKAYWLHFSSDAAACAPSQVIHASIKCIKQSIRTGEAGDVAL